MTMAIQQEMAAPPPSRGFVALAARATFRWVSTLGLFSLVGLLASWGSYLVIFAELWSHGPVMPGAGHSALGALIALVVVLLHPVGLVSLVYLVAFPALFVFVGHQTGIRRAVARVAEGKSRDAARWLVGRVWSPYLEMVRASSIGTPGQILEVFCAGALVSPGAKRMFRWSLSCAKVSHLASSPDLVSLTRADPEKAESDLVLMVARRLQAVIETEVIRPLLVLLAVVIFFTLLGPVWLPWLG